jgi:hypothetical protein
MDCLAFYSVLNKKKSSTSETQIQMAPDENRVPCILFGTSTPMAVPPDPLNEYAVFHPVCNDMIYCIYLEHGDFVGCHYIVSEEK